MQLYCRGGIVVADHTDAQNVPASAYGAGIVIIPVADGTLLARHGDLPAGWPSDARDPRPFAAPAPTPALLKAYAANARFRKEISGVTIAGITIATDRGSQAMMTGAVMAAQLDPEFTTQWKAANGSFVTLTATKIIAAVRAVSDRIAVCFAREAAAVAEIGADAPTITTFEQVEAFFEGL